MDGTGTVFGERGRFGWSEVLGWFVGGRVGGLWRGRWVQCAVEGLRWVRWGSEDGVWTRDMGARPVCGR